MRSKTNYNFSGGNPVQKQKIFGRKKRFSFAGWIGGFILIVVIILAGIYFVYPALTPNKIKGDFLDMTIVTTKDGKQNLWILTDGSFNFIQTTSSPGRTSTGRKCFFCKTWTYVYDPASGNVLKKTKTDLQDIVLHVDMLYSKGKVWELTREYGENDPKIEAYDAETGDLIMDTKSFIDKHPELKPGLTTLQCYERSHLLKLATKDGREGMIYNIDNDKLYKNNVEEEEAIKQEQQLITLPVLVAEKGSESRKKLYKITGPKGIIFNAGLDDFVRNPQIINSFEGGKSEPTTDKIYLDGIIYYQDADCVIVISVDQLGNKSNRLMTCIDLKSGNEKWTVQQNDMFKRMKIDENEDSFSSLFFTKDKIEVKRQANLVVLQYEGEGLMGFDFNTGKKLWTLEI